MKNLFSILAVLCLTLFGGVLLSSCGEKDTYKISVRYNLENQNLVRLYFMNGEETVGEDSNSKYSVPANSNIRVLVYAYDYGVDFSNLKILVNGQERSVVKNADYSSMPESGNLNYGYFLLTKISKDISIEVSGVSKIVSTFDFEVDDIKDQAVIEKLKITSICLTYGEITEDEGEQPEPVFLNLYDYLTQNEDTSFEREYQYSDSIYNPYTTFRLKFDGGSPFDLSESLPFQVKTADGEIRDIKSMDNLNGTYVVNLGNLIESSEYTIMINYKNLEYQNYTLSLPSDNQTYLVEVEDVAINYANDVEITVLKLLEDGTDYSNMKVFLNTIELTKIEGSESADSVKYLIPQYMTPTKAGGYMAYEIKITGIVYPDETYLSSVNVIDPLQGTQLVAPSINSLSAEGENVLPLGYGENGEILSLNGSTNCVAWNYNHLLNQQNYFSRYDLLDYDIYVNDTFLMNVAEKIGETKQDVVIEIKDGYTFKAFFNEDMQTFDSFRLEYIVNQDVVFTFQNFKTLSKNILVSYSFDDFRISNVEFAVFNSSGEMKTTGWAQLAKDVGINVLVEGGDVVKYRLTTERIAIAEREFKIENSDISAGQLSSEVVEGDQKVYSILSYIVSDIQYDGAMDFKLVFAGIAL